MRHLKQIYTTNSYNERNDKKTPWTSKKKKILWFLIRGSKIEPESPR